MGEDFIFGVTSYSDYVVKRRQDELHSVWHYHRIEPRDPQPDQPVKILVDIGCNHRADAVFCYWTTADEQPAGRAGKATCGNVLALEKEVPIWEDLVWGYVDRWVGILPPQADGTQVRYRIEAWDEHQGISAFADHSGADPMQGPPFAFHVDNWQAPDWIRDAIIYQIIVDRFYPGDGQKWKDTNDMGGIFGGTLCGIIDKLPYISSLGFNTLWISPISEGPSSHHYDTTDHRTVAAHFGTNVMFRELVQKAHAMGMRVLLDFVAHATSDQHPFLKSARENRDSPYYPFYIFNQWPDDYDCFFGVKSLPYLNLEYAPARQYIIDSALYWMDYAVDGFRLDYAIKPSRDFWVSLQSALRMVRPDVCTLGEAVTSPEGLRTFEGKLDGCLDFSLADAIRSTFVYQKNDLSFFSQFLDLHERYPTPNFIRPSFIDNHDMNRVLFIADGDIRKVKMAATCQFTLSQPPIVLYGTEVGLSQKVDCRNGLDVVREPMPWDDYQNGDLMKFYRKLCQARSSCPAIRRGSRKTLYVDKSTFVYSKSQGTETCIVVLNVGDKKQILLKTENLSKQYVDMLGEGSYSRTGDALNLKLEPWQASILLPE
ncbi:MAG TPA: alpha-amylase family glycosyl hydrolase [Anaerolineales bacterium]